MRTRWLVPVVASMALAAGAAGAPARSLADIKWIPATLPNAKVGQSYPLVDLFGDNGQLPGRNITIGSPPHCPVDNGDFEACRAMVPKGMLLGAPGGNYSGYTLSGTPEQAGTFTLTFNFSDHDTPPGVPSRVVSHTWTLVVGPAKPKGADLSVAVHGPGVLPKNDAATYTVVVRNKGPEDATEVEATIDYPYAIEVGRVKSRLGTCTKGRVSVACSVAKLTSGAHMDIDIRIRVNPGRGSSDLAAKVTSATDDPDPKNNKVVRHLLVGGPPDVSIEITGTRKIAWTRGETVEGVYANARYANARYFVVVTNHGPGPVTGVLVTASWFDGRGKPIAPVALLALNPECKPDGLPLAAFHRTTCRRDNLGSGASWTIRVQLSLEFPRLGLTPEEALALAESGALVVRADVKVNEQERKPPGLTNNRAKKTSVFDEVK